MARVWTQGNSLMELIRNYWMKAAVQHNNLNSIQREAQGLKATIRVELIGCKD